MEVSSSSSPSVVQDFLYNAGLGSPYSRAIVGALLMGSYLYLAKPSSSFDAAGNTKSFFLTAKDPKNSTVLHPFLLIAIAAFVFGCFL